MTSLANYLLLPLLLHLLPPLATPLTVSTWNILCAEDEYSTSWGAPLQLATCADNQTACTASRRQRQWDVLDDWAGDVLLVQELEDDFMLMQAPSSPWKLVSRSSQCAILYNAGNGDTTLTSSSLSLPIPSLTGCDSAPMATITEGGVDYTLVSVHVASSINITEWYNELAAITSPFPHLIMGGDYNVNHTAIDDDGSILRVVAPASALGGGTSQYQADWMGSFDFFLTNVLSPSVKEANIVGFMPKDVVGLPQDNVVLNDAQFSVIDGDLYYDEARLFEENKLLVYQSGVEEGLSDHLFVEGAFYS
jgi:hypothetical protein